MLSDVAAEKLGVACKLEDVQRSEMTGVLKATKL